MRDKEDVGERIGQRIFASTGFEPKEGSRFSVWLWKVEGAGVALEWFAKAVVPFRLREGRGKVMKVGFLHYMKATEALGAMKKKPRDIFVKGLLLTESTTMIVVRGFNMGFWRYASGVDLNAFDS